LLRAIGTRRLAPLFRLIVQTASTARELSHGLLVKVSSLAIECLDEDTCFSGGLGDVVPEERRKAKHTVRWSDRFGNTQKSFQAIDPQLKKEFFCTQLICRISGKGDPLMFPSPHQHAHTLGTL
jgi:hypothetical protein